MAYCTQADIEDFLTSQLALDTVLQLTADEVAAQISSADREIDIYLAPVVDTLPFTTVPDAVKEISIQLSAANCLDAGRADFGMQAGNGAPGEVPRSQALRSRAYRMLKTLVANPEALGSVYSSAPSSGGILYKDEVFTDDSFGGW